MADMYASVLGTTVMRHRAIPARPASLDGEVVITPRDTWLAAVRQRPAPKASGLGRHDQILTIDRISANLAHVKLTCAIPPRFFTDILSFVKVQDGWKIAQKVFTTDVRG